MYRLVWFVLLFFSSMVYGLQEDEEQPLSFGQFAIGANDVVSTLIIPHQSAPISVTNKIYQISAGQHGRYRLTGYPTHTPLAISIADFNITRSGINEPLQIRNITFDPIITDANGEAILRIGATLKTTGTGNPYGDGAYSGALSIVISW